MTDEKLIKAKNIKRQLENLEFNIQRALCLWEKHKDKPIQESQDIEAISIEAKKSMEKKHEELTREFYNL